MDGAATFAIFGQAAGLAGQDLVGFSTDLVQLASDLASFNNTSPEEAIQAIGAALRGESEPIRAYGVLLDDATLKARAFEMGIYDGTGVLTQQQRVLAAQAEILAQTTTQQGDFARTADGAANAQRIATAEPRTRRRRSGRTSSRSTQRSSRSSARWPRVFGELPGPVQTAVVALIGITVLAGPLSGVAGGIKAITTAVMGLSPAMRTLSLSMGAVGALVGLAVIAYQVYSGRKQEAEARTKGLRDALLGEAAAQNEALVALAENDKAVRAYLVSAKELGFTNQALAQFVRDGTGALASYASGWPGHHRDHRWRLPATVRAGEADRRPVTDPGRDQRSRVGGHRRLGNDGGRRRLPRLHHRVGRSARSREGTPVDTGAGEHRHRRDRRRSRRRR
jgi:hypothetical protein